MADTKTKHKEKAFSNIGTKSFITVVSLLVAMLIVAGSLSYIIPQGEFLRDADGNIIINRDEETGDIISSTYQKGEVKGIAIWRIITAPVRVFVSDDALTIIMISVFLLIMSGVFNLMEKTGGVKVLICRIMSLLRDKGGPVVCFTVFIFMLFGSFFGMFEELVTLLPLVVIFMLSMGMDTMMGLGACMMAACFGFAAAITNPFSVGLATQIAGTTTTDGVWLRLVFFVITYITLCAFLMLYLRKIKKHPEASLTFKTDEIHREELKALSNVQICDGDKIFKTYAIFFAIQGVILILIASVRAIAGLAIPILAVSFLVFGTIAGLRVSKDKLSVFKALLQGCITMLPAVLMIALASSVKLVMTESGIIDTVMNAVIDLLDGKDGFIAILLIYILILILQIFIGSASAKIFLVMPIVMPIAVALGLSPAVVILAYCMADGFTDVILPTNPVLLVGLSMVNVSYGQWVKWTWKLQVLLFLMSLGVLAFAVAIGY